MKLIRQAAQSECALACLAMVANSLGHELDLPEMRERFRISLNGARVSDLAEAADALGLSCRALRVEPDDLSDLALPVILHWRMTHFVVLRRISPTSIEIVDPAYGLQRLNRDQLSKHFTGIALEFDRKAEFAPIKSKRGLTLTELWRGVTGLGVAAAQVLTLAIGTQLAALAAPLFVQLVVDQAAIGAGISGLTPLALAFALAFATGALISAARSWVSAYYSAHLGYAALQKIVSRLMRLPIAFFEGRHVGDILSRLSSARSVQAIITESFTVTVIDGLLSIIILVVIAAYDLLAGLVTLITTLVIAGLQWILASRAAPIQERSIAASAAEQSYLIETVRAATTIRIFGSELARFANWRILFERALRPTLDVAKISSVARSMNEALSSFQLVAVAAIGILAVDRGSMTIGMFVALLTYRQIFAGNILSLVTQLGVFRTVGIHLGRLSDIANTDVDPAFHRGFVPPSLSSSRVVFENVTFRYGAGAPDVLKAASCEIEDGEFVALIGPSGAGKTTMIKLLLGLHMPDAGRVLVDGKHLDGATASVWRKQVGTVLQGDRLFSGSLGQNIAFFDPDAREADLRAAAKAADIDEHIQSLPLGYHTPVGDMGSTLSGGQYQRVLLARALYRRPAVLVLDEGTANLDPDSERRVVEAIERMGCSRIVVAHRPALVECAHRVLRVERGVITPAIPQSSAPEKFASGAGGSLYSA